MRKREIPAATGPFRDPEQRAEWYRNMEALEARARARDSRADEKKAKRRARGEVWNAKTKRWEQGRPTSPGLTDPGGRGRSDGSE